MRTEGQSARIRCLAKAVELLDENPDGQGGPSAENHRFQGMRLIEASGSKKRRQLACPALGVSGVFELSLGRLDGL
jgi:hypothetical protein